ncbi:hypothetical protein EV650_0067 [Kribbella kalugense]|uniref:Uncharacterized protein n=1 Tax=Kribbella kalugense TaxID=2512221 RepID=A0A4R7ZZM9_9ACTN|nr:hypothetical protein EV650_0067 [Kribbella kalugense]
MLEHAAASQSGSLRGREFRALKLGLQALAEGREDEYDGKRLGYSPGHHDLRDCAELKVPVVPEARHGHDLGPSHRLIYREFEADDGGAPYREAVCFAPRGSDLPFHIAGARLGREIGRPVPELAHLPNHRPTFRRGAAEPTGPPRLPLPPDLRKALAVASDVSPASGAVTAQRSAQPPSTTARRGIPPGRER